MSVLFESSPLTFKWRYLSVVALVFLSFQGASARRVKTPPDATLDAASVDEKKLASMIALQSLIQDGNTNKADRASAVEDAHDDGANNIHGLSSVVEKEPDTVKTDMPASTSIASSKEAHSSDEDLGHWWDKSVNALKKSSFVALEEHIMLGDRASFFLISVGVVMVLLFFVFCCGWLFMFNAESRERRKHYHNGSLIYEWDQSWLDANIYIKPPDGLKKPDFDIKIQARSLKVGLKGKAPFLRDHLYDGVNSETSSWSLKGGELQIRLVKAQRKEWPVVCLHQKRTSTSATS